MSAKNEPECWTCKHFGGDVAHRICKAHQFPIPRGQSAYFICRDFEHYLFPDIGLAYAMADKEKMKEGVLYTYHFMDALPPREYAKFAELRDGDDWSRPR